MKRILVTGGAGFLGSHLCDRLVSMGHDVVCLDNLFTSQKSNIEHLLGQKNFEFVRHDITEPIMLEVDEIFNLACPAAPGHYQYNPIKTMKTSVLGAINVLGLAKRVRAKIFHASTSEVYGDPDVHPQPESYRGNVNPIGPRACYDEGKRAAETLFFDYHRQNKVNIRVVRIFNTYGPRMHPYDGRVVSNFIRQALAGEPITIYGAGTQTRSFCYVDDLLDGFLALMNAPDDLPGPVNIGGTLRRIVADHQCEATSRGRSAPAMSRHHARADTAGMGAARSTPRGSGPNDRLFQVDRSGEVSCADAELLTGTCRSFRAMKQSPVRKRKDHDCA